MWLQSTPLRFGNHKSIATKRRRDDKAHRSALEITNQSQRNDGATIKHAAPLWKSQINRNETTAQR